MRYPIVLYPQSIKKLTELQLPKPIENEIELSTPEEDFPTPVTNRQSKNTWQYRILLSIWLSWLLGAIIQLLTMFISKNLVGTGFLIIAWSLLCLGIYLGTRRYFSQKQIQLQKQQVAAAQQKLQAQKIRLKEIQKETQKKRMQEWQEYRQTLLNKFLAQRVEPVAFNSDARQGASEGPFKLICQKYFDKVIQAAEFEIPDFQHNYSADFLVFHEATGLGIDVEIDEPYALLSKEPIHCQDVNSDSRRNDFFLSRGWVVIRFAERQVVKAPERCCKVIAQTIAQVTGDRTCLEQLEHFPDLFPEKTWTTQRAKQLAQKDYRFRYLPKKVKISIQNKRRRFSRDRH